MVVKELKLQPDIIFLGTQKNTGLGEKSPAILGWGGLASRDFHY